MNIELAAAAVAALIPYLTKFAETATERLGEKAADGGTKLLIWLRSKVTGRAKEALADIEANPHSADNQADLRKQIGRLLDDDPALCRELEALIAGSAASGEGMVQSVSGPGSVGNQICGDNNQVNVSH